ncbi:MAG: adenylate/guanylate cyclase domain-containing protein [Bacteroidales bacterium]|nr:adenylate/guanylate cyclase domain-containing protein [Bacteroidales bacterium]
MKNIKYKKVPKFFGFRIYFFSTILYYLLVLPFLLILTVKYAPELKQFGEKKSKPIEFNYDSLQVLIDSVSKIIDDKQIDQLLDDSIFIKKDTLSKSIITINTTSGDKTTAISLNSANKEETSHINKSFGLLFNLLLISFLLGLIFNIPFKRYFRKKRKNKKISKKLFNFCKKFLLRSPLINSGILFLAYGIAHGYMIYILLSENVFDVELERSLYIKFFYISLVASLLSVLFVYFWEKHRVHIKYIEHIFSKEQLRKRIFSLKVGRIRNRLLISSIMTTLLPLTIVILYLYLSLTSLGNMYADLNSLTAEETKILFGDYSKFTKTDLLNDVNINWMFYVNAINSLFMFIGIYSGIIISFIYILFFVKWTTQDIVQPVKELLTNMRKTGEGEMDNFGIVRTNDEIGELTEGYNEMSQKIKDYINNISRMNEAYSRFVPRQFLDFLGKKTFMDISLGDQVQKEMTVMFTDIRSFTNISEEMTPKENFDFINYYLGYMEPVIRNNNGFIDKFMGDSIMALFSESAEDAINAAIEMRIKLTQFNQVMGQFGKPAVESGIGIHTGNLMLGVVGGEGRMDGTVISDAVNLASRLEGLTKIYGNSIIISQDTLIKLEDPSHYNYRFLDITKVKGKKQAIYIFEIIDGEPEDIKQLKTQTKSQFAKALNFYKNKEFIKALQQFEEVFKINNQDFTASLYIKRCKDFLEYGIPDNWDGIETIKRKN